MWYLSQMSPTKCMGSSNRVILVIKLLVTQYYYHMNITRSWKIIVNLFPNVLYFMMGLMNFIHDIAYYFADKFHSEWLEACLDFTCGIPNDYQIIHPKSKIESIIGMVETNSSHKQSLKSTYQALSLQRKPSNILQLIYHVSTTLDHNDLS